MKGFGEDIIQVHVEPHKAARGALRLFSEAKALPHIYNQRLAASLSLSFIYIYIYVGLY